ncbi:MAG: exodeoxyribonuclease VII large subunit [Ardenticatenia bacterium]|nr:exodeoxyribonuclease VII large subunit [Ardenticatenia bacterium]
MDQLPLFAQDGGESLDRPSPRVFSVSEIINRIKTLLESDWSLQDLWLEGEISNWRQSPSRHIYFTLKDQEASIRCVLWRSTARRLPYLPSGDGEAVLAHGHISVYETQGQYQFYVDDLQPIGVGTLYAQFEQLKARLAEEGLFEQAKRPLPRFPQRIGVVTSPVGAVLRDILNVLRRRYPLPEVILSPTSVQGDQAPHQIVSALRALGRVEGIDVIILARGGGSLEDLWAFNDEQVARTVATSPAPVVCGVGHETDVTIADFAADLRAPTPSAAAELVVPSRAELTRQLTDLRMRLSAVAEEMIIGRQQRLQAERRALQRLSPQSWIDRQRQRLDDLSQAAHKTSTHRLRLQRERVNSLSSRVLALNPTATLERGYAIVRRMEDNLVVVRIRQVAPGDQLSVQVSDGTFESTVQDGNA